MQIDVCIATLHRDLADQALQRIEMYAAVPARITPHIALADAQTNKGVPATYAALSARCTGDVVLFMHDDVWVSHWRWDSALCAHFEAHPHCAVAGWSGARGLGHPDLHELPFDNSLLARYDFASALADAEVHGRRLQQPERMATCDGYAIAVRGAWLRSAKPWNDMMAYDFPHFHGYDHYLCLLAREQSREVWALPINCRHLGGRTSLSEKYKEWQSVTGVTDAEAHDRGHKVLMERFGGLLPAWESQ